jgi:uncharacterized protein (UPF0335 family)
MPDDAAHTTVNAATREELLSIVERIEHLEGERRDIAEQIKDVMAEAKGRGYHTASIRKIVQLRRKTPDDRAEEEAMLDLYLETLGMS